jgi:hypothetical protein
VEPEGDLEPLDDFVVVEPVAVKVVRRGKLIARIQG